MPFNTSFISIPLEGLIWKILPDESGNFLLVEYRNDKKRKVDFLCIDMKTKKIKWQGTNIKELWWLGLQNIIGEKVIIHGYKNSKSPEHKGLYLLDIASGKLILENKELSFILSSPAYIIAGNNDPDKPLFFKIDILSGLSIPIEQAAIPELEEKKSKEVYKLPVMYATDSTHFMTIATFISQQLNVEAISSIEYMELHQYIIVSFYTSEQTAINNFLVVFDEEGALLLKDEIGRSLTGVGQDTFFIYGNNLVYIKNKSELVIREI